VAYIDESGYAKRFTQRELDQLGATGGGLDFAQAASDATETIDSYLAAIPGRTFTLPLAVPPARIVGVAADLTRYELWAQRASEEVKTRRDQAMEYLHDLVSGKAVLSVEAETPADPYTTNPVARVGFRSAPRVFGSCGPIGGIYDPRNGLRGIMWTPSDDCP
jgi:phage gp36-like protein